MIIATHPQLTEGFVTPLADVEPRHIPLARIPMLRFSFMRFGRGGAFKAFELAMRGRLGLTVIGGAVAIVELPNG